MIRRVIILVVFAAALPQSQLLQAADWPWLRPCAGSPLTCEVWFNTSARVEGVTGSIDGVVQPLSYKSYGQSGSAGAMALLVQGQGLSESQLGALRAALGEALRSAPEPQKLGLYLAAEGLRPLAPLGTPPAQQRAALQNMPTQIPPASSARAAVDLVHVLGGAPQRRRVLLWITPPRALSAAERGELAKALADEKVRLLVVQLQSSELEENSGAALREVAQGSGGLFFSARQSEWRTRLTALAGYSLNGGVLSLAAPGLCGAQRLRLQSTPADRVPAMELALNLAACPTAPEPATPPTPPAEQPAPSAEPASEQPSEAPPQAPSPPAETPPSAEEAPTDEASSPTWPVYLAGGGLLLCMLLLALLMRRRAAVTEAPGALARLREEAAGRSHALMATVVTLGRNRDCDLVFEDDTVSGKHALLRRGEDGRWRIVDTLSSNGVRLNGEPVDEAPLSSGDRIQLGETQLLFEEG